MLIPETAVLSAIPEPSKSTTPTSPTPHHQDLAGSTFQPEEDNRHYKLPQPIAKWERLVITNAKLERKRRKQKLIIVTHVMGRFPTLRLQLGLRTQREYEVGCGLACHEDRLGCHHYKKEKVPPDMLHIPWKTRRKMEQRGLSAGADGKQEEKPQCLSAALLAQGEAVFPNSLSPRNSRFYLC